MTLFDYDDGRGSDEYVSDLLQLIQSGRQQEMTQPMQMQVNVRPAPQYGMSGGGGMTEEQAEDAEKAQIISAIGGALSGGIGAYGQAQAAQPQTPPAATYSATPTAASQAGSSLPIGGRSNQHLPASQSYAYQNIGIGTSPTNMYGGTAGGLTPAGQNVVGALAGYGQTPSSPTGASAIKSPQLQAVSGMPNGFEIQNPSEALARQAWRKSKPGGMSQEDIWSLYAGGGENTLPSGALTDATLPPEFVLSGGRYRVGDGRVIPEAAQFMLPYGMYSGQGYR